MAGKGKTKTRIRVIGDLRSCNKIFGKGKHKRTLYFAPQSLNLGVGRRGHIEAKHLMGVESRTVKVMPLWTTKEQEELFDRCARDSMSEAARLTW